MGFCLPKFETEKFIEALKAGKIVPEKLIVMSSEQRRTFLEQFVGEENVRDVNALLESKILLKDQKRGMVTWAKKVAGLSEPARRDLISRIEKMDKILDPADARVFLEDLAAKKLGTEVTFEEAKQITEFSKQLVEAKTKALDILAKKGKDIKNWTPAERLTGVEYGTKLALFKDYIDSLKLPETSISRDLINAVKDPRKLPIFLGNLSKSIVASFDNSFFLNQGIFALFDPKTTAKWFSAFGKSFSDIKKALGGGNPTVGVRGEVYGRPNALDGTYERMKLDVGLHTEEAIPTTIGEKIPVLGRFFKASNSAYNGAALRLRADIADMKIREFEKNGIDLKDKAEAESLGQTINSFTGRGHVGLSNEGLLSAENVNAFIFSIKFAKSKFDVMTAHLFSDKVTPYAKKQAAYSLVRIIGASALVFAISEALNPGSTELDPRASNFGKIRIGKTWYPTPLSFGGIPNVIARTLVPTKHNGVWGLWMKSGTGKWSNLLSNKYGAVTANDIFVGYFEGKAAPVVRAVLDIWNGKDFNGNKSTPENVALNLVTPISPGNIVRTAQNDNEEYKLLNYFMQVLGSNPSVPKK